MAKARMSVVKTHDGKRAAAYLRKSTDQQEASIPGQRSAIQAYALKHGFEIACEYIDSGISGVDSTSDRREFTRLVKDAESGKFGYVIAWDLSRLTRSDPMETIYELRPLRKANVKILLTDREVPLDWDSFAGMLTLSVEAESNNQYVKKLARGTTRGQMLLAKEGKWVAGRPPLGYIVGKDKRLQLGPKKEVDAVRWAFDAYAAGQSYRMVQKGLTERGFAMVVTSVRILLSNRIYTGDFVWGRNTQAKFYSMRGGEISTEFNNGQTSEVDQIVVPNAHPAIIDRSRFDAIQSMFAKRKVVTTPTKGGGGGEYVLTGLLRCADCGYGMVGSKTPTIDGGFNLFYRCGGSQVKGVAFCHAHNTFQKDILKAIFETLSERFTNEETASKIWAEFEKQLRQQSEAVDVNQLKADLEKEKSKLQKASKRLVEVDVDLVPIVQDQIRKIKPVVEQLEREIKAASTNVADAMHDYDERLRQSMELFKQFKTIYKRADPVLLRSFLQSAIESIEIKTRRESVGSRYKYIFEGGNIIVKQDASLFSSW